MLRLTLGLAAMILGLSWPTLALAQSRCTTQWNPVLRQYETRCQDGTRETEQYNPVLRGWERTITPPTQSPYESPIRCLRQYNPVLRQWEEVCR